MNLGGEANRHFPAITKGLLRGGVAQGLNRKDQSRQKRVGGVIVVVEGLNDQRGDKGDGVEMEVGLARIRIGLVEEGVSGGEVGEEVLEAEEEGEVMEVGEELVLSVEKKGILQGSVLVLILEGSRGEEEMMMTMEVSEVIGEEEMKEDLEVDSLLDGELLEEEMMTMLDLPGELPSQMMEPPLDGVERVSTTMEPVQVGELTRVSTTMAEAQAGEPASKKMMEELQDGTKQFQR